MNEFLQRLKQRKLVQWTLAYVAAAFALLQGIDIVAQRFGWPEQTMRFVIIALSVGVVNLYTDEVGNAALPTRFAAAQQQSAPSKTSNSVSSGRRSIPFLVPLCVVAFLLAGGALWFFFGHSVRPSANNASLTSPPPVAASTIPEKSIAVLPFENLSDEKANAYFADDVRVMLAQRY